MLSSVELRVFLGVLHNRASSPQAILSCELSSHLTFSYSVSHCLHNVYLGTTSLNPFSFNIFPSQH